MNGVIAGLDINVQTPSTLLGGLDSTFFDISKPNIHDSKTEFLEEKRAVEKALDQADGLFQFLASGFRDDAVGKEVAQRVGAYIDARARDRLGKLTVEDAGDLVRKNAADVGFTYSAAVISFDLIMELTQRKQELDNQEAVFWKVKSRPPNHYARTIALRLAKLIARETGRKPTFGTSRDGGHPSTQFGRALEEIFGILEIDANVKHPAKWAIGQLTDDDLVQPARNYLANLGAGFGFDSAPKRNALAAISEELTKPTGQ